MDNRNCFALRYDASAENTSGEIRMEGGAVALSMPNVHPAGQGGVVDVNLRLRDVPPGKRMALGVLLYDGDAVKAVRTLWLPAHHEEDRMDVLVEHVLFVLPQLDAGMQLCLRAAAHCI